MKEFIDKLISRLEEEHERCINRYGIVGGNAPAMEVKQCIDIVNELAEEYKGGWIACKEEMPRKDGNYLVCDAQGNIYIARYYAGSTTFNRNVGFVARAWQPLPAPYTEGE